jgi:hypothetical protein
MAFIRLLLLCGILGFAAQSLATPAVALYYGQSIPVKEFRAFDIVVVEPDHDHDPIRQRVLGSELYAYVSLAEVLASRSYFSDIPVAWKIARNDAWNSHVIDQTPEAWPAFFAERVIAPLWNKGYRGFFLDTLDSYRLAREFNEADQQAGLVRVIETLHARYPGIQLILNRGFEIVPRVRDKIRMVAAESLFRSWNAGAQRYEAVSQPDREWLTAQLKTIRERDGLDILSIDYVEPNQRELMRETAGKISELGFIPWVSDAALESMGIGSIETVARRILVVYNGNESPSLNYSNAHRFLQMPLNHMGYVVDYADVSNPLPENIHGDRHAGIVTWFSGGISSQHHRKLASWLIKHIRQGVPVAMIGDIGMAPDRSFASTLGMQLPNAPPSPPFTVQQQHRMIGFEAAPMPNRIDLPVFLAGSGSIEPLITVLDQRGEKFAAGAILPWGGFILDPFALIEVPGTDQARWVVDPFAFLKAALRLPAMPVPDVTTENGRRLFFSHIDGDGFPSLAELPGSPIAAQVLLQEILEKYRIPTTVSVIEAETAPHGLFPKLSPALEDIARQIFRLPHVEIASHTFAHPFIWDLSVTGLSKNENRELGIYHLDVPGYRFDPEREILGSIAYIRERLAPPGKPVNILLWSGDTAPSAETLAIVEHAGLLNMNGGDTSITRDNPSLTAVGAFGIEKSGFLQVYAPITNENIYTNLWRGPFYGFERVIESFEMTGAPRRLKPVNIYYHTYSASKRAGLRALHKAFAWTEKQELHPVFASEYIRKVRDFHDLAIARENDGWRIRSNGELRTFRWEGPAPDLGTASGVAGYRPGPEGQYLHLSGASAWFSPGDSASPAKPYLYDSNARIHHWQQGRNNLAFTLKGHAPLEFRLANATTCTVRSNGRLLRPKQSSPQDGVAVQSYTLSHAEAPIQINCRDN